MCHSELASRMCFGMFSVQALSTSKFMFNKSLFSTDAKRFTTLYMAMNFAMPWRDLLQVFMLVVALPINKFADIQTLQNICRKIRIA